MNHRNITTTIFCVLVACGMIFMASSQAKAQITYRIIGSTNTIFDGSGPVGRFESYTAVFEIDDSVVDSDASPDRGQYDGAILSSTIEFSGGYTSTADFSGGRVVVRKNESGLGLFLVSPGFASSILIYSLESSGDGDIDALFTSPMEVAGLTDSLFNFSEIDGTSIAGFNITGEPTMSLEVIVDAPITLLGDVDLSGNVDFLDINSFVTVLSTGTYQREADMNTDGTVNFLDIAPFVTYLAGS